MSDETEQSWTSELDVDAALETLEEWYHVPALSAVLAFMFWVRVQAWENFTQNGEVYLSGNDAYYHLRQVTYTVHHWPSTMPFDPWTHFPQGTIAGQFGTLFDQILATAALVVGLGSPSQHTIGMVLVFAPAVFGALLAIPVYFMGRRLGGRLGGVFAATILALLPGYFLIRTRAGSADHNGAEPLFQAFAVLGLMVALAVAERENPVFEQLLDRDTAGLRRVVGWSVLAGVATAVYMWVWNPGVLLVGIFGFFFMVKLVSDYVSGRSPDHVAVVGAVSMTTTGLLMFVPFAETSFGVTAYSYLQPLFSLAVGFGCVFLAWLAREWDSRGFGELSYVGAVFGLLALGIVVVMFALPSLWSTVQTNLLRFVGFSAGAATRTIGEAQPFLARTRTYGGINVAEVIFLEYGLAFFTALLGAAAILLGPHLKSGRVNRIAGAATAVVVVVLMFYAPGVPHFVGSIFGYGGQLTALAIVAVTLTALAVTGEYEAEKLLVVVWGAFITSAAFTQVRFNYYLVVPVVVLNAYVLKGVLGLVDLDKPASRIEDVSWYQVSVVVMVVLVVLVPVAAPAIAEATNNDSKPGSASPITVTNSQNQNIPLQSAITIGMNNGPGAVVQWDDAMEWMNQHTPRQGTWDGANNADRMDYYGTYHETSDFDYPEGAYGVMSWWDYGHWLTVEGHTVPHANPFQQGATTAANFLLAQNETEARNVLEGIQEDDAKMRYVAVDWKMIMPPLPYLQGGQSKFGAPVVFYDGPHNFSGNDFYRRAYNARWQQGQPTNVQYLQQAPLLKQQPYFESMMVRLYRYHGSAKQPQPVVLDWRRTYGEATELLVFDANTTNVRQFQNMSAAEAYVANDSTSQIGGYRDVPQEYVPALEHYRLVGVSANHTAPANLWYFGGELNPSYYPSWVKLFERVEGAEVTGTAPANTTVRATVTMRLSQMKNAQGASPTFTYTQRAEVGPDGEFSMVLPYSSTGYENFGPANGHTNVSVRAAGPYEFTTGNMTAEGTLNTIEYNATAHVTEAQVLGESDETVTVELTRRVVDRPDGANNTTNTSLVAPPPSALELDRPAGATAESGTGGSPAGDSAGSAGSAGGSGLALAAVPALAGIAAVRRAG